jgi:hypothetical protein
VILVLSLEGAMNLSVRHFIVDGESVQKVSRKKREGFYHKNENTLPEYAGKIINVADVCVELVKSKPYRIVRIDCVKHKVDQNGGLDNEYQAEHIKHVSHELEPPSITVGSDVIEASNVFEAKRLKCKYTWSLNGLVLRKMQSMLKVISYDTCGI